MKILHNPLTSHSAALLVLRLVLGVVFFAHGAQKVLGWFGGYGLAGTTQFFQATFGIPPLLAYLSHFTEFLGGIAIILGLLTRVFALGLTINMLVAMTVAHIGNGFFNSGGGIEFPLALLGVALYLFLVGGGEYSLDAKIFAKPEASAG
ncbi:MAG: DoxX family protein [Bacteroidota bacterium]